MKQQKTHYGIICKHCKKPNNCDELVKDALKEKVEEMFDMMCEHTSKELGMNCKTMFNTGCNHCSIYKFRKDFDKRFLK